MIRPEYTPHLGNQALVRNGYVGYATFLQNQAEKFAISEHHPAAQALYEFEAELTTAEWREFKHI